MKWKSPIISNKRETILGYIITIIMSPILIPAFTVIGIMFSILWIKRFIFGPNKYWAKWFAWHPIYVPSYYISDIASDHGAWIWFEYVERECWGLSSPIYYRKINGEYYD